MINDEWYIRKVYRKDGVYFRVYCNVKFIDEFDDYNVAEQYILNKVR